MRGRVTLTDLELKERATAAAFGFVDPGLYGPDGIEFEYESFNRAGEMVCFGKIDHIPGVQVTVRYIETVETYQRQGYGTAVLCWISDHFGGLPVVPAAERGEAGVAFWTALRRRPRNALAVREEISITDASLLLRQAIARAAALNKSYEPGQAK